MLPTELLDDIISLTLPAGLESIVLSCKTIYHIDKSHIQRHNEYRRRWRFFNLNDDAPKDYDIRIPQELLIAITEDPLVADYNEVARFARLWPEDQYDRNKVQRIGTERVARISKDKGKKAAIQALEQRWQAMAKSLHTHKSDSKVWMERPSIFEGEYDEASELYAVVLLLGLLPNLKELRMPNSWGNREFGPDVSAMVKIITATANDPGSPHASLSQLERLIPYSTSDGYPMNELTELSSFMALPRLKELYAYSCFAAEDSYRTEIPFKWPDPDLDSRLRRIELVGSCINSDHIAELLSHTPQLSVLKYAHNTPWSSPQRGFDAGAFVDAVGRVRGDTLTELAIMTDEVGDSTTGVTSLHNFKRLEEIEFDIYVFNAPAYGSDGRHGTTSPTPSSWSTADIPPLVELLPQSIRRVHLFISDYPDNIAVEVLNQLLQGSVSKEAALANSMELDIRSPRGRLERSDLPYFPLGRKVERHPGHRCILSWLRPEFKASLVPISRCEASSMSTSKDWGQRILCCSISSREALETLCKENLWSAESADDDADHYADHYADEPLWVQDFYQRFGPLKRYYMYDY